MRRLVFDYTRWGRISRHSREDSPRVLFLGSGVGAITLEGLLKNGINVTQVVSQKRDSVISLAKANDISSSVERENVNLNKLSIGKNIDYVVVAFLDYILPKAQVKRYYKKILGVHASALPEYRGAYPIEAALLDDKKMTDIVTFLMTEGVDEGPILMKKRFSLRQGLESREYGDDTAKDLYCEVAYRAGPLLAETLLNMKKIKPKPQKGTPSYSKKPTRWNLQVDWQNHTAERILNMQRVTAKVYTIYNHNLIILSSLELENGCPLSSIPPGAVCSTNDGENRVVTVDRKELKLSSAKFDGYPLGKLNFNDYLACAYHLDEKPQFASRS